MGFPKGWELGEKLRIIYLKLFLGGRGSKSREMVGKIVMAAEQVGSMLFGHWNMLKTYR